MSDNKDIKNKQKQTEITKDSVTKLGDQEWD